MSKKTSPTAILEYTVSLTPNLINKNYKETILQECIKNLCGKCDKENGYILQVYPNIVILDNQVSTTNCNVFFRVNVPIRSCIPILNETYTGKIVIIMQGKGVFVIVNERMKIMIPALNMSSNYVIQKDALMNTKTKEKFVINDEITTKLVNFRYEKQNFSCIGSL